MKEDDLPGLLRQWQVNPSRSAEFSPGVWRRIEARRRGGSWAGFARGHPAMLTALVAAAIVTGGWSGIEAAQARVEAGRAAIADSYVRSLDPRQLTLP